MKQSGLCSRLSGLRRSTRHYGAALERNGIPFKLFALHPRMFRRAKSDETKLLAHETIFRISSRYPETGNP
ncbi:MAG: hypothetical protein EON84_15950 [Bradyrhizobiaceae bacterium]|jgi:hypothetical protein|nr:MAG: hypothetical protein EON84_15950 [Bradyrhizobiaceae bacterium]